MKQNLPTRKKFATDQEESLRQTSLEEFERNQSSKQLTESARQSVKTIEQILTEHIDESGFTKSREIAAKTDMNPSTVGALISYVQERSNEIVIERYARTNATTWRVEVSR